MARPKAISGLAVVDPSRVKTISPSLIGSLAIELAKKLP